MEYKYSTLILEKLLYDQYEQHCNIMSTTVIKALNLLQISKIIYGIEYGVTSYIMLKSDIITLTHFWEKKLSKFNILLNITTGQL